jgi:hypothetical protein
MVWKLRVNICRNLIDTAKTFPLMSAPSATFVIRIRISRENLCEVGALAKAESIHRCRTSWWIVPRVLQCCANGLHDMAVLTSYARCVDIIRGIARAALHVFLYGSELMQPKRVSCLCNHPSGGGGTPLGPPACRMMS